MRILVVSPHLPYDGIPHAGGMYLLKHLEQLAATHDVTLMVPANAEVLQFLPRAPRWLDILPTPFEADARPGIVGQVDRARRRLRFASLGAPALRGLRSAGIRGRAVAADVVELHWMESAMLTRELRSGGVSTPLVVIAYDVTSEAAASRQARLAGAWGRGWSRLWYRARARTERADLSAADLVLVFKDQDRDFLQRMGVRTPSEVVDPYLELPDEGSTPHRRPSSLLFTGAMWRPENQDGAQWFLRSVWPRVRASIPDASFAIVGAGPPGWLEDLARVSPGVSVTGEVPSLGPYYEGAAGFVAPLFVAGGLKFKVPQAMAHALPVVATPTAAAGVVDLAPPGSFWAITADPIEMADAVVDLFRRPEDAAAVGAAAARWCRDHYSFEGSTRRVLGWYERLVER